MAYTSVQQPQRANSLTLANPIVRNLEKKGDKNAATTCTYGGIIGKTVYFLIATAIGSFLSLIIHGILMKVVGGNAISASDENGIFNFSIAPVEAVILLVVLAISLIVPFLSWFVQKTIPVTGTIYCVAQGMLIGYITVFLAEEYKFLSVLAMIITFALVASMLLFYMKGLIKVTGRFRRIITAIFFGIVFSGIIYFILSIIPGIRGSVLYQGINGIVSNPVISIGISIVYVIIAALFMVSDFDTIQRCVEYNMDKKYEWMAAWGLAYTILYIYFKILRILIMIFGNSRGGNSKSRSF